MQRSAWHLILENGQHLAIAQQQVLEYLHQVDAIQVPDCAQRCQQILLWRNHMVPVLGVADDVTRHSHLLVILFQNGPHTDYVALALTSPPGSILVRDGDQCEAADTQTAYWQDALQCCIELENAKIALVDFAGLGNTEASANADPDVITLR